MKIVKLLATLVVASIFLQGCFYSQAQVKMIDSGTKPTIAVVAQIPDVVNIIKLGYTMFGNGFMAKDVKYGFSDLVENYGNHKLESDAKVNVYKLRDSEKKYLLSIKPGKNGYDSKTFVNSISEWAKQKHIDFVAFVSITSSENVIYGRAGSPTGFGIMDDSVNGTYLFSVLEVRLINSNMPEVADIKTATSYQLIPQILSESNERFTEDDYKNLSVSNLNRVAVRLDPVIKSNIEFILKDLKLTSGPTGMTWIDKMERSTQNLF